jgi:hypothetical protein
MLILPARARQDGDEAAAGAVDEAQVIETAELGVGDIEEIRTAGHGPQRRPGLDVGDGVVGVAVGGAKLDRHTAIGIGGQNEQQLLQIRAMVFGITVGDRRCPLPGLTDPAVRY